MRAFMILAFVVVVSARPEAGYNYNAPNRGGGQQLGGSSFGSSGIGTSSFNSGSVIGLSGSGGNYNSGLGGNYNSGSGGSYSSGGNYNSGASSSGGFSSGVSSGGFSSGVSSGGFNSGVSSGGFSSGVSSGGFATGGQQTLIQKHIYVHVPPPEPEVSRPQQQIQAGVAQKHYKIIFIKAPSPPSISPAQIALAQQNQEKTIVYVLVKKPDEIGDVQIPTIAPTQPSKPEVYFIKYKTTNQSNAGSAISASSVGGGSAVGIGGGQISSGSASSSINGAPAQSYGPPTQNYGPPAQSGPY